MIKQQFAKKRSSANLADGTIRLEHEHFLFYLLRKEVSQ